MKKETVFIMILGFAEVILLCHLLNWLGLKYYIILLAMLVVVGLFFLIKNFGMVKRNIKQFIPYHLAFFLVGIADMISTKHFVFNEGIGNETNLLVVYLYSNMGNYAFFVIPFIMVLILGFLLFSLIGYVRKDIIKRAYKIAICIYMIVPIWNIIV